MNDRGELVLTDVTKTYGTLTVLAGVSLAVRPGKAVAIVGPSGSGKTTLLNIAGSLDSPTSGSVTLGDVDAASLAGNDLADFRARRVGFVFQDHHLLGHLTTLDNVLIPAMALGRAREAQARARELLASLGLADRADSMPGRMSGGERQRTAFARALVNDPDLLLCDEPTGSLDPDTGAAVIAMALGLARKEGKTVLVVTHNLAHAALFDRCLRLEHGQLQDVGDSG
jgi:lipoprotein-releasing system ATP-binding protein